MKGVRLSIISKKSKIDNKVNVKLNDLKEKWSKSKPLIVLEDEPNKPKSLVKPKKITRKEQRLIDEKEFAQQILNSNQSDLSFEEVKKKEKTN